MQKIPVCPLYSCAKRGRCRPLLSELLRSLGVGTQHAALTGAQRVRDEASETVTMGLQVADLTAYTLGSVS